METIWQDRADVTEIPEGSVMTIVKKYDTWGLRPLADICRRRGNLISAPITTHIGIDQPSSEVAAPWKDTAAKIVAAIQQHQKICVSLDYDCDGQTAGACMVKVLQACGADVHWVVPDRLADGYGISIPKVTQEVPSGSLIITVDNGITAVEEVKALKEKGYDVIITDHHLKEDTVGLPPTETILDPKLFCSEKDDEYMAPGVYVSAKVSLLVAKQFVSDEVYFTLWQYCAQLVALGIVSDVIELNPLMRQQLRLGLSELRTSQHDGINALLANCRILETQDITATVLSFSVIPSLNAAGRMGEPHKAVELLLMSTDDSFNKTQSTLAANTLRHINSDRKIIEQTIFTEACDLADKLLDKYKFSVVIYGKNWHAGVLGIVAARMKEIYGRPIIVLSDRENQLEGSGRSIESVSLFESLQNCHELLERFGGHAVACGLQLKPEKLEEFRAKLDAEIGKQGNLPPITFNVDTTVSIEDLDDVRLTLALTNFEPFGNRNEQLVYRINNVEILRSEVRNNALYLTLANSYGRRVTISKFRPTEAWINIPEGTMCDVLVTPMPLYFSNRVSVEYRILDIKLHQVLN